MATTIQQLERMIADNKRIETELREGIAQVDRKVDVLLGINELLRQALMAAQLHLMVRPAQRLPKAEENLKALIKEALELPHPSKPAAEKSA